MPEPYIGEIRMFGGNFAPDGWAFCHGQLLPIAENEALYQLIGTTYGGDGQETFALPDLRGRAPTHEGNTFVLAQTGGAETVTLTVNQIAVHKHQLVAQGANARETGVQDNLVAEGTKRFYATPSTPSPMGMSTAPVGGNQPHENMQPYLCTSFIISLFGIFPSPT